MPSTAEAGTIARGSIFTVFGTNLGPRESAVATSFPLASELAGVSIRVVQYDLTLQAYPLFVSENQINAILPSDVPLGEAVIKVDFAGGGTGLVPPHITVVDRSFGIFTISGTGRGPGAIQNFVSDSERPLNSTLVSARPGDVVTLWGTGLGPGADADNVMATPVDLPGNFNVYVGGKPAELLYKGRSSCCAGVDQVSIRLPADVSLGCYVPVIVRADYSISNAATLSISADRGRCSDSVNPYLSWGANDGSEAPRLGVVSLTRTVPGPGIQPPADVTGSRVDASFQTVANRAWFFDTALSLPPIGTCTTYTFHDRPVKLGDAVPASPIEAGDALDLTGPQGARAIPRVVPGIYQAGYADASLFSPGTFSLEAQADGEITAIEGQVAVPAPIVWTNSSQIDTVYRDEGVTVVWSAQGAPGQYVRIMGVATRSSTAGESDGGLFLCLADAKSGVFLVPPQTLTNVPWTQDTVEAPAGVLMVGSSPLVEEPNLAGPGIDYGLLTYSVLTAKAVSYR